MPTVIFMSFPLCAVCKMSVTLALFEEKNMIPNAHKLPRILSALLVSDSVYFLFNYICMKYLFVKILCHLMYKHVYFCTFTF